MNTHNFICYECGKQYQDKSTDKTMESECPMCGEWNYSIKPVKKNKESLINIPKDLKIDVSIIEEIIESEKKAERLALKRLSELENLSKQKVSKEYKAGFIQAFIELIWERDNEKNKK